MRPKWPLTVSIAITIGVETQHTGLDAVPLKSCGNIVICSCVLFINVVVSLISAGDKVR